MTFLLTTGRYPDNLFLSWEMWVLLKRKILYTKKKLGIYTSSSLSTLSYAT